MPFHWEVGFRCWPDVVVATRSHKCAVPEERDRTQEAWYKRHGHKALKIVCIA